MPFTKGLRAAGVLGPTEGRVAVAGHWVAAVAADMSDRAVLLAALECVSVLARGRLTPSVKYDRPLQTQELMGV